MMSSGRLILFEKSFENQTKKMIFLWPALAGCISLNSSVATECNAAFFPPLSNKVCRLSLPQAVVYPKTTQEVAQVVRFARAEGLQLSYMSGGHSYVCESSKPNSLQISLRDLNEITVHADDTVTLGPGNTFFEVLRELPREKYSIAHGGCLSVGVGGFFLHGGIHAPSTRLTGTGNTTIVKLTMVSANGTVYHLDASSPHQDLWNAMRIAGSHFGVATSITVRFLREPEATSFIFLFSMGERDFSRAWAKAVQKTREDGLGADITLDGGGPQRLVRFLAESTDPSQYVIQVSVRNNRGLNLRSVQLSRAYFYLTSIFPLPTVLSMIPVDGVEDQSSAYDLTGGAWTSTFMCFDPDCPLEEMVYLLTSHFRSYAYIDAQNACWQVFSTTTSFPGQMCFEYNCPAMATFDRELPSLDKKLKEMCPAWTRSANVKSPGTPTAEYYTNFGELVQLKQKWDPDNFLNEMV